MTKNKDYKNFRKYRDCEREKQSRELHTKIFNLREKLSSKLPINEFAKNVQPLEVENFLASSYRDYREIELNFFKEIYGQCDETTLVQDPNWDHFIKNDAKKTGDSSFLELHTKIQVQRAECAEEYWADFIHTECPEALIAYLTAGGEINHIVMSAIGCVFETTFKKKKLERFTTVLEIRKILKETQFKISQTEACKILAERTLLANNKKSKYDLDETSDVESAIRKFNRHIEYHEKETGISISDPFPKCI